MTTYQNRWRISASITAAGLLTALSLASTPCAAGALSNADKRFVKAAAQGGMAEVRLGEIAVRNGRSEEVKHFGQRMIDDHSKANDELKNVAANKGIDLPSHVDAESRMMMHKLERLHGAAFDAAYIRDMRNDHRKDIMEFRKEANRGNDSDVRAFAAKTLPVIREHYKMINEIGGNRSAMMRAHRTNRNKM